MKKNKLMLIGCLISYFPIAAEAGSPNMGTLSSGNALKLKGKLVLTTSHLSEMSFDGLRRKDLGRRGVAGCAASGDDSIRNISDGIFDVTSSWIQGSSNAPFFSAVTLRSTLRKGTESGPSLDFACVLLNKLPSGKTCTNDELNTARNFHPGSAELSSAYTEASSLKADLEAKQVELEELRKKAKLAQVRLNQAKSDLEFELQKSESDEKVMRVESSRNQVKDAELAYVDADSSREAAQTRFDESRKRREQVEAQIAAGQKKHEDFAAKTKKLMSKCFGEAGTLTLTDLGQVFGVSIALDSTPKKAPQSDASETTTDAGVEFAPAK